MNKWAVIIAVISVSVISTEAQYLDKEHLSIDAEALEGNMLPHNPDVRKSLRSRFCGIYSIGMGYQTLPSDSSVFASEYNYPLFGLRMSVADFSCIKMVEDSRLGNIYLLYGRMERPLIRKGCWQINYMLDAGLSFATAPHNRFTNPDNPFIGFRLMVYVGFGVGVNYKVTSRFEVGLSANLRHYSNGRLGMPNSGINLFGAALSARYYLDPQPELFSKMPKWEFQKEWLFHLSAGVGGQASLQEWTLDSHADAKDRRAHYRLRPKFSFSADAMYRYTPKYATGIGIDLFHTGHIGLLRQWDRQLYPDRNPDNLKYSRLAVGVAVNQEIYYRNLALNASVGYYVFRRVGIHDKERFYQRAGFRYYFPKLNNAFVGIAIKAHRFTQAEYLELSIGIRFTKKPSKFSKKEWNR